MKERVIMFGDAIVAIIITIMVLEVPIEFQANGDVDFGLFFRTIGIYFISYCFVANIWFQTAYSFNQIENLRNREILTYMMLLFLLSIVPSATRLLIEDTSRETVLVYGILTLVVMLVMQELNIILTRQWVKNPDTMGFYIHYLRRRELTDLFFRTALLLFGFFFTQPALIIYLILSVVGLLQNVVDREENGFVDSLNTEDQVHYFNGRDVLWNSPSNRQISLLKSSLQNEEESTEGWVAFMDRWKDQLNHQIAEKAELKQMGDQGNQNTEELKEDLDDLQRQKDRLTRKQEALETREQKLRQRQVRKKEQMTEREEHKQKEMNHRKEKLQERQEKHRADLEHHEQQIQRHQKQNEEHAERRKEKMQKREAKDQEKIEHQKEKIQSEHKEEQ